MEGKGRERKGREGKETVLNHLWVLPLSPGAPSNLRLLRISEHHILSVP
jgi:hypothetical protein